MRDGHAAMGPWALFALAVACAGPQQARLRVVREEPPSEARCDMPLPSAPASSVRPQRYTVELTLDPRQETFSGLVEIELALAEPTRQLWLRGAGLTVQGASVTVRGTTRPARVVHRGEDELGFLLERPVGPGPATLRVAWQGRASPLESPGVMRLEDAGRWYARARMRAEDARRVLPCFGDPSLRVPWQLTLRVPREDRAYAELPVASEEVGPDGLRTVRFRPQPPLGEALCFTVGPASLDGGERGSHSGPAASTPARGRRAPSA